MTTDEFLSGFSWLFPFQKSSDEGSSGALELRVATTGTRAALAVWRRPHIPSCDVSGVPPGSCSGEDAGSDGLVAQLVRAHA